MFWSPASSSSVMNGMAFQASATRIMLSARNGSPSHTTFWSMMPSCSADGVEHAVVGVVDPLPEHGVGDRRQRPGDEQDDPEEARWRPLGVFSRSASDQAEMPDRDDLDEREVERVAKRQRERRVGQQPLVVGRGRSTREVMPPGGEGDLAGRTAAAAPAMGYASTPSSTRSAGATSQRPVRRRRARYPERGGPTSIARPPAPCPAQARRLTIAVTRSDAVLSVVAASCCAGQRLLDLRAQGLRDLVVVRGHEAVVGVLRLLQDRGGVGATWPGPRGRSGPTAGWAASRCPSTGSSGPRGRGRTR